VKENNSTTMPPEPILKNYNIGTVQEVLPITQGLINQTFKVNTSDSTFILQKLHSIYSRNAVQNVVSVTEYLASKNIVTPKIVPTQIGALYVENKGEIWRLMTFVPGKIYSVVQDENNVYEAAKLLGIFHKTLGSSDISFLEPRAQADSTSHYKLFVQVAAKTKMTGEMELWKKEMLSQIPLLDLPKNLRKNITHGDTKITNIIFDEEGKHARAFIDLDDVGDKNNILIDLAQAARSWCGQSEGDQHNHLNVSYFEALWRGYKEGSENFATKEERMLLTQALLCVTLTLASRFLRDFYEDSYFGFDATRYATRKDHNMARARGQMALYYDIKKKIKALKAIVA
jgi:Ser/Thr protein kinase RdoA (MazF antagonist)